MDILNAMPAASSEIADGQDTEPHRTAFVEACIGHSGADVVDRLRAIARTMTQDARNPVPVYRAAELCRRYGDLDLWRHGVRLALTLEHRTQEAIHERGRARLTLGDWGGWVDLEARRFRPKSPTFESTLARRLMWSRRVWDGLEDLHNLTLLVVMEQGFGDVIQMLRFLPVLAHKAHSIVVPIQASLNDLVRHNYGGIINLVAYDFDLENLVFDRCIWSMSLPALLGHLPSFVPVVAPNPTKLRNTGKHQCVGLCWAGSPSYPKDVYRSIPIADLAPLFERDDLFQPSRSAGVRG